VKLITTEMGYLSEDRGLSFGAQVALLKLVAVYKGKISDGNCLIQTAVPHL
jgi:hypothetical protein